MPANGHSMPYRTCEENLVFWHHKHVWRRDLEIKLGESAIEDLEIMIRHPDFLQEDDFRIEAGYEMFEIVIVPPETLNVERY